MRSGCDSAIFVTLINKRLFIGVAGLSPVSPYEQQDSLDNEVRTTCVSSWINHSIRELNIGSICSRRWF